METLNVFLCLLVLSIGPNLAPTLNLGRDCKPANTGRARDVHSIVLQLNDMA